MNAKQIVLVRHGETEWALAGRHTGRKDLPLTPHGVEQAAGLAARLARWSFATVLCSPLLRARQTCEGAGFADRALLDPDLQEWDYGDYEGRTGPEIRATRPDWKLFRDGCPGGESPSDVIARADRVRDRLATLAGDVLVVAHGHLLRILTARSLDLPIDSDRLSALAPASIAVLRSEPAGIRLDLWNEVG